MDSIGDIVGVNGDAAQAVTLALHKEYHKEHEDDSTEYVGEYDDIKLINGGFFGLVK